MRPFMDCSCARQCSRVTKQCIEVGRVYRDQAPRDVRERNYGWSIHRTPQRRFPTGSLLVPLRGSLDGYRHYSHQRFGQDLLEPVSFHHVSLPVSDSNGLQSVPRLSDASSPFQVSVPLMHTTVMANHFVASRKSNPFIKNW